MTNFLKFLVLAFFLIGQFAFSQNSTESKRVLIFYSSIGMGHLSAARAIESNLKQEDPNVVVELKNIRDTISSKLLAGLDEWFFWFLVKRFPNKFDSLFQKGMKSGEKAPELPVSTMYDQGKIREKIDEFKPTHIITTHYGSTLSLIELRRQGLLRDIPVAWLHTDYFTGFFPRISKNIEMTFLGIDALMGKWTQAGVPQDRVTTTGLPISTSVFAPVDRAAVLKEQNLDPSKKTIVLMSGGEGVGDFPTIVSSIANSVKEPVQIIAVCAKNEKHQKTLEALKYKLPSHVDLRVHGFVKNDLVLNWIKASDVFITKSGGLSPTEGFAINKPIVLLDVYGGHERENARLFESLELAIVNRDQKTIGTDVIRLLTDEILVSKMLKAQAAFKNSFNLNAINRFVLDNKSNRMEPMLDFGIEGGHGVRNGEKALAQLDKDFPADVEIILSYGKSDTGELFRGDANPFGHIAIRIDGTVYTLNGRAQAGVENELVFRTTLEKYLYSIEREVKNMEHTDAFGSAYARRNISLRVHGVTSQEKAAMLAYFKEVDSAFNQGLIGYDNKKFNCADLVRIALQKAGFLSGLQKKKYTMPLDVLTDYKNHFENDVRFRSEIIMYRQAPGSLNVFKGLVFPISPYQLGRSLKNMIFKKSMDPFEAQATKRVYVASNNGEAYYENLNGLSVAQRQEQLEKVKKELNDKYESMLAQEQELSKLDSEIFGAEGLVKQLKERFMLSVSEFTSDEIVKIVSGEINPQSFPNELKRQKALIASRALGQWEQSQAKFQSLLDKQVQVELDYLIEATHFVLKSILEDAELRFNTSKTSEMKKLRSTIDAVLAEYAKYINNRDQYGLPKDGPTRTMPYRMFFAGAKDVIDLYQGMTGQALENTPAWTRISNKIVRAGKFTVTFAKLTPSVAKMVFSIIFRNSESREAISQVGLAPFEKAAEVLKFEPKVENRERLQEIMDQAKRDPMVVNLIVPNHSHPIHDGVLMGSLGLKDYMIVVALDQSLPKSLADKAEKAPSIVNVGRGSDLPIIKILDTLNKTSLRNVFIYPQGSVSAGIYETLPVRAKFSHGLVRRLVEAGYKVNILPVTYPDANRFLHENSISASLSEAPGRKEKVPLRAIVGELIKPDVVAALVRSGKFDLLSLMIRSAWLENMDSSDQRIRGLFRSESLVTELGQRYNINMRSDRATEQAIMCRKVVGGN